jgi:hypothetical protein
VRGADVDLDVSTSDILANLPFGATISSATTC